MGLSYTGKTEKRVSKKGISMSGERPVRVLIVDDSPFVRKALLRIFSSDPSMEVVGVARDGADAVRKAVSLNPDVITLDIMMPFMNGIEALKTIMEVRAVPVLMLSQFTHEGAELTLRALDYGAMDFVDKAAVGIMDFSELASEIITKAKAISGHRPKRLPEGRHLHKTYEPSGAVEAVAIGASTGGPPALQTILQSFPRSIGFGVLVVQHMPPGFTATLASRLDGICDVAVKEAVNGDRVEHGTVLIAPSGLHMKVESAGGQCSVVLCSEPSGEIHKPSIDVLFSSVAETYKEKCIGVVLTGMGSDGAKGVKEIKENGGATMAQDESTSVIFGMPKVAVETHSVDIVLPITDIADYILKMA
jgi:two-component system chemotaxis response regulator CheB